MNENNNLLLNLGFSKFIKDILMNFDLKSIPKPVLIIGSRDDGINSLVNNVASGYLCPEMCFSNIDQCNICKQISKSIYPDFHKIDNDNEDKIKSEDIEDYIVRKSYSSSTNVRGKVFAIMNSHNMTKQAMNVLLKLYEEPMPGNIYLLTTNNINNIPKTIISRCDVYTIPILSKDNFINLCNTEIGLSDSKLISKIWFVARGKLNLSNLMINDINLADDYLSEINKFVNFVSYPLNIKIQSSDYYLDMLKNDYSKYVFLTEITIHIIKDVILSRYYASNIDPIFEYFKKRFDDYENSKCIEIIDTLNSFDKYYNNNVNPSLIIDNMIYSI